MITTISAITIGGLLFVNIFSDAKKTIEKIERTNPIEIKYEPKQLVGKEYEEVIKEHLKKVALLPADLKKAYHLKKKLAYKAKGILLSDSLKRSQLALDKSKRNNGILDTSYRFPNLGYEEITANNRQKVIMFGRV